MALLAVILAGAAAWIFGAIWYMVMAKPWMAAAGLTEAQIDRKNMLPFVLSFVFTLLVAGMTRHVLASAGIDSFGGSLVSGLGLGLFIALPWLATNYMFAQRPQSLILIDGTYTVVGCTLIGAVLGLF